MQQYSVQSLASSVQKSSDFGPRTADARPRIQNPKPVSYTPKHLAERILAEQVRGILGDLSPKERKILEMRHGLMDGIYHTLEEVGREFGVTRERIRQIEAKALEKIRTHNKARHLKSY